MRIDKFGIWKVLGIEPTTDKREIKKAYARKVKTCHPEEHPEEFKQLYDAYQMALEGCLSVTHDIGRSAVQAVSISESEQEKIPDESSGIAEHEKVCMSLEQAENEKTRNEKNAGGNIYNEEQCIENDDEDDVKSHRFQELFEQNDRKKQVVWNRLIFLWKNYIKGKHSKNMKALRQFLQGSEFLNIKDLDETLTIIIGLLGEDLGRITKNISDVLWNIYDFDNFDVQYGNDLNGLCHKKLYETLKREQEVKRLKREKMAGKLRNVILAGIAAAAVLWICGIAVYSTKTNKIRAQCIKAVSDAISHKYYEFSFGGALNEWEISASDTENTYVISTEAALKHDRRCKATIRVEARCDKKGNVTIISDDFGEKGIKIIAADLGVICDTSVMNTPDKNYIIVELRSSDYLPGFAEDICSLSRKRTVKNQNIASLAFCCRNSVYAEYYLTGGEGGLPRAVIWDVDEIPELGEDTLREEILQSLREYYFHYEPWHIKNTVTLEDEESYNEAAAAFEPEQELLRAASADAQELYEIGKSCGVSVLLFEDISEYEGEICITEGDLYRIMLKSGGVLGESLLAYIDDKSTKGAIIYFADSKDTDVVYTVYYNEKPYTFGKNGKRIIPCSEALSILKGEGIKG